MVRKRRSAVSNAPTPSTSPTQQQSKRQRRRRPVESSEESDTAGASTSALQQPPVKATPKPADSRSSKSRDSRASRSGHQDDINAESRESSAETPNEDATNSSRKRRAVTDSSDAEDTPSSENVPPDAVDSPVVESAIGAVPADPHLTSTPVQQARAMELPDVVSESEHAASPRADAALGAEQDGADEAEQDGADEAEQDGADEAEEETIENDHNLSVMVDSHLTEPVTAYPSMPDIPKLTDRLMITKMVCRDFKSYAGVKELGPFHKSFSSIVGPNGSGKSNVIDAMLFVFGFRSQKLRSKRVANLIHNSARSSPDSCKVEVFFQRIHDRDDGSYNVLPDSEFSVSRTVTKENASTYKVNIGGQKRTVTTKELQAVLKTAGVDLQHNRFLILQGEVEQISLMKPKAQTENDEGMLEYLEDIIGSSQYKEQIAELSVQLEQLTEQKELRQDRVKVAEKAKNGLEPGMNAAIGYLRRENELKRYKHKVLQYTIYDRTRRLQDAEQKCAEAEGELNQVLEKLKEVREENASKENAIGEKQKQREKLNNSEEKHKKQFQSFETKDEALLTEKKTLVTRVDKLRKELRKAESLLEAARLQPETSAREIEELNVKLEGLNEKKKSLDEKVAAGTARLDAETKDLQAEKTKHEEDLMQMQEGYDSKKAAVELAQSELDVYLRDVNSSKNKLEEMKGQLRETEQSLSEKTKASDWAVKKLPELQKTVKEDSEKQTALHGEEEEVQRRLHETRSRVTEARQTITDSRTHNALLDALMQQRDNGRLHGILGRLGDLGAIDAKYDVAISTACRSLDNIVTETMDQAKAAVSFLKTTNLGRTTFIALDQQRFSQRDMGQKKTPEDAPRLFDLIQVTDANQHILPAFYYAMRDTLVAKDLEQATRIAYSGHRWRVVTLKGDVIETSGTMAGGGGRPMRGKMGSRLRNEPDITPEQLAELDARNEADKNRLDAIRVECRALDDRVHRSRQEWQTVKAQAERATAELTQLKERRKELQRGVAEQEKLVEATASEDKEDEGRQEKEAGLERLKGEFDGVAAQYRKIEAEVVQCHNGIEEVSRKLVTVHQEKLEEVERQLKDVKAAVNKAQVRINTAQREAAKEERKLGSVKEEIENNEQRLQAIGGEREQLTADADACLQKLDKLKADIEQLDKEIKEARVAMKEQGGAEQELAQQELKLNANHQNFVSVRDKMKSDLSNRKKAIKQITLNDIASLLQPLPDDGSASEDESQVEDDEEPLMQLSEEQLEELDIEDLKSRELQLEQQLEREQPNLGVIEDYRKKLKVFLNCLHEYGLIDNERTKCKNDYESARKARFDMFMTGYNIISTKLKEMYRTITLGGDAELELVDSMDPFVDGVTFSVRPPKKSWKNISNLSGGEKTLSSLSLVFALHHYKPTPFYVMDEIDAALDFKNISIVANYIKERTKNNAQFIIVSLRNDMFELADVLIGIYKTYDMTKTITWIPPPLALQPQPPNRYAAASPKSDVTQVKQASRTTSAASLYPQLVPPIKTTPSSLKTTPSTLKTTPSTLKTTASTLASQPVAEASPE